MQLDITPVSSDDPASIEAWCEVVRQIRDHDFPGWRDLTPEMARLMFAVPSPFGRLEGWIVHRGGQLVGRVNFEIPTRENLDNFKADIWVLPQHRRQGIGRRLYDFALQRAADLDRKRIMGMTLWELPGIPAPNFDGVRFAEALGFSSALPEVARRLDLTKVDDAALESMRLSALERSDGYSLRKWKNPHPDGYLADLAYLDSRLMSDAPMGDLVMEAPKVDVSRLLEQQQSNADRGRINYHAAAVHNETGRIVAWTCIAKERSLDWNAFQLITIVDPDHRGRRLGALIKVENLRHFRKAEPSVWAIDTFNAASNSYMIAINELMGFRPLFAFQNWQREI